MSKESNDTEYGLFLEAGDENIFPICVQWLQNEDKSECDMYLLLFQVCFYHFTFSSGLEKKGTGYFING